MRRVLVATVVVLAACGDNEHPPAGAPLAPSDRVAIVAHTDDDLLFLQPDLDDALARGEAVTIVYVMQGLASQPPSATDIRIRGSETAYGELVASRDWSCGWISLAGMPVRHCRLADRPLSLVYLGYPDGGKQGDHADSLLHLWEGTIASTYTIGRYSTRVDRERLSAGLAELLWQTSPREILTEDFTSQHGRDHSDHLMTAALAVVAAARAGASGQLVGFRAYNIDTEPANKPADAVSEGDQLMGYYWACYRGCAACGDQSCTQLDPQHVTWLQRRYANAQRVPPLDGQLRLGNACAAIAGDAIALGACATAPSWHFDRDGRMQAPDGRCATVAHDTYVLADCDGSAAQTILLDDEGHVWSAMPSATAQPFDHLLCLTDAGAELCGADRDVRWTLAQPAVTSELGVLAGAPLELGDVGGSPAAELCAATANGIACAQGIGDGTFGAVAIVSRLVVDPASLRFGDIDGDGRDDACGIAGSAVLCVLAAENFAQAHTWLQLMPPIDDTTISFVPITSMHRDALCARDAQGPRCALSTGTAFARPAPVSGAVSNGPLWFADLDGDGAPEWCTADATGPRCAVLGEAVAMPWSFALGGVPEAASDQLDAAHAQLADIDGDGRADLCRITAAGVACAASQGRAFGPSHVVLAAPPGDQLVLGDLDGDGRADACMIAGTSITCARSP